MDIGEKLKLLEKTKETLDKLTDELRKRAYMKAQNERIYRMALAIKRRDSDGFRRKKSCF